MLCSMHYMEFLIDLLNSSYVVVCLYMVPVMVVLGAGLRLAAEDLGVGRRLQDD